MARGRRAVNLTAWSHDFHGSLESRILLRFLIGSIQTALLLGAVLSVPSAVDQGLFLPQEEGSAGRTGPDRRGMALAFKRVRRGVLGSSANWSVRRLLSSTPTNCSRDVRKKTGAAAARPRHALPREGMDTLSPKPSTVERKQRCSSQPHSTQTLGPRLNLRRSLSRFQARSGSLLRRAARAIPSMGSGYKAFTDVRERAGDDKQ